MRKTFSLIIAASFLLSACNTIEGLGKDLQSAGKKIEDTAEK